MTNLEMLFQAMKRYQGVRMTARQEYRDTLDKIKAAKGSAFYDDEQTRAMQRRNDALEAAQADCRHAVDSALHLMREAAEKRQTIAPTEEQVRVLSVLKMRDKLNKAELDAAANAMSGNAIGLSLIQEMADANGILGANYKSLARDGLSLGDAADTLRDLTKSLAANIADKVGARRSSVIAAEHNYRFNGVGYNPDDLPGEEPYTSERDFYAGMLSVPFDVLAATFN